MKLRCYHKGQKMVQLGKVLANQIWSHWIHWWKNRIKLFSDFYPSADMCT